jgi:hypothetical protein
MELNSSGIKRNRMIIRCDYLGTEEIYCKSRGDGFGWEWGDGEGCGSGDGSDEFFISFVHDGIDDIKQTYCGKGYINGTG